MLINIEIKNSLLETSKDRTCFRVSSFFYSWSSVNWAKPRWSLFVTGPFIECPSLIGYYVGTNQIKKIGIGYDCGQK
jgi:hypothetical protein